MTTVRLKRARFDSWLTLASCLVEIAFCFENFAVVNDSFDT